MGEYNRNGRPRIAVVLAGMHVEYSYEVLQGIKSEALKKDFDIYIFCANAEANKTIKNVIGEYNIYQVANFDAFDGIILFPNLIQEHTVLIDILERVKKSNVPTICVDYFEEDFYYIGIENYSSMKQLVSHLIEEHGLTKINYLSGQDFNTDSQERLRAYCDALQEHGIPVEEKRILKGAFTYDFGQQATRKILESGEELPQAIVCATDWIALGARIVLLEYGIKIPEQIVITGYDNLYDARNAVPSITSVDRDMRNVGVLSVDRMARIIEGKEIPKKEYFPSVPIYAESCGCVTPGSVDATVMKKAYRDYKERIERKLSSGNKIIEELNDCQTFSEFLNEFKKNITEFDSDAFYLCLDKAFKKDLACTDLIEGQGNFHDNMQAIGFSNELSVVLAYENGKFVCYEDFAASDMLPTIKTASEKPHFYIFLPLHFRDNFMGYIVLDNSEYVFAGAVFYSLLLNLSISFESLRKQAHLKSMLQKMDRMYMIEPLTGLYNRFGFAKYTTDSFKRCIKNNDEIMILFADMDGLKKINDVYGHEKGDVAICAIAEAINEACFGHEICARFGGDEFVVFAEGYSEEDAKAFGQRFEKIMNDKNQNIRQPFEIEASYGYITVKPKTGESIDKYIDMADNIMYYNKKSKKKRKDYHKIEKNS